MKNADGKADVKRHFWTNIQQVQEVSWIPNAREGCVMVKCYDQHGWFLYGGSNMEPLT